MGEQAHDDAPRPLEGVKVLDLGRYYQAPYAAHLMAMAGADVIKLEPVSGEPMRRRPEAGSQASFALAMLSSNKRGITLNLKHPHGQALLTQLAKHVDVLIENFAAGVMDRLGVGYKALREHNPRLIYASGTGFGLSGPDKDRLAMDPVAQAVGGITGVTGPPDGPPYKAGASVADFLGGTHLYGGIVTALLRVERTGRGSLVEVSLQEAIYPSLASALATMHYRGLKAVRQGNQHGTIAPFNVYQARDGYIALLCTTDDQWARLCNAMERPELASDERFAKNRARIGDQARTDAVVEQWTRSLTRAEIFERAKEHDAVAAPVRTLDEVMHDSHMHERGMLVAVDHPDLGRVILPTSPIRYGDFSPPALRPSPKLGEHNEEIYGGWLGLSDQALSELRAQGVI